MPPAEPPRAVVIFNPTAGHRRQARLRLALARLAAAGLVPEVLETTHPGHATPLARAAAGRAPLVVAAGGDGTIAEVAAGLAGTAARLGVLPLGTANVLAAELGIPPAMAAAAEALATGDVLAIHPGLARFADGGERLFVQMLGAGFDAAVVAALDLGLKRRIGRGAYVLQTLRELPRYRFPAIRVAFEDEVVMAGSVIVSKGRLYAGRNLLAPAAEMSAPGFQVALFRPRGPFATALYGATLPFDLLPHMPGVRLRRALRLRIEGAGVAVQMDGDACGALPVDIAPAPAALRIMVPRAATGGFRVAA